MNYKYFSDIYTGENEFQREKLQYLFDKSFREKDEHLLRSQYIALRQLQFNEELISSSEIINLSSLAEAVTSACDILSAPTGISFIYCGNDSCYTYGNQKAILKALLNLLSNAYLYGKDNLITVKTIAAKNHSKIEVLNGGNFYKTNPSGKGLKFVRDICEKNNGKFFIEQSSFHTKAVMVFKKVNHSTFENSTGNPDTLALVYDRISPVCVELFGMEYH